MQVTAALASAEIPEPRLEARLIFAEVLGKSPSEVTAFTDCTEQQKEKISALLSERIKHKPLDKVLGHREFYKYDFIVDENVLSPRPDTEITAEEALKILRDMPKARIADLGCGSGCIIETLLCEMPETKGVAVDISGKALAVARKNAERLGVADRLLFVCADWKDKNFCAAAGTGFDLIVSNPPYISDEDIKDLDAEVKNHDPLVALAGGSDGFDCYRQIAKIAPAMLRDGGYILLEAGAGQAGKIADIFAEKDLLHCCTVKDLAGINRCVIMQKASCQE